MYTFAKSNINDIGMPPKPAVMWNMNRFMVIGNSMIRAIGMNMPAKIIRPNTASKNRIT